MSDTISSRRRFLFNAAVGVAGVSLAGLSSAKDAAGPAGTTGAGARSVASSPLAAMGPVKQVDAGVLNVGYVEYGPESGHPIFLLHGWPYDIHSYVDVAPMLAAQGYRVIVPHLRGHGTTRFLDDATPRAGQQAAIGQDVIDLMDALHIPEAVLAGYDWGGRAACVAAALKPTRVVGLVSVNSYLIQDIAHADLPLDPKIEAGFWYQFYFGTERGRKGLTANRNGIARLMWERNSPSWHFDDATFARSAANFDNPDYVEVTLHSYRHRLGLAPGYADYDTIEQKLAALPAIKAPTITLDGVEDGVIRATDGKSSAARFAGPRQHRQIAGAGHNLPQEAPQAFADAVLELARNGKWRT